MKLNCDQCLQPIRLEHADPVLTYRGESLVALDASAAALAMIVHAKQHA